MANHSLVGGNKEKDPLPVGVVDTVVCKYYNYYLYTGIIKPRCVTSLIEILQQFIQTLAFSPTVAHICILLYVWQIFG